MLFRENITLYYCYVFYSYWMNGKKIDYRLLIKTYNIIVGWIGRLKLNHTVLRVMAIIILNVSILPENDVNILGTRIIYISLYTS